MLRVLNEKFPNFLLYHLYESTFLSEADIGKEYG